MEMLLPVMVYLKVRITAGSSSVPVNYNWYDGSPQIGNNFYRVKAIDKAGQTKYTSVAKVIIDKGKPRIVIYPNPIRGNSLRLQFTNIDKGMYNIKLFNSLGQLVFQRQVLHPGESAVQQVAIDKMLTKGTYQVLVIGENGVKLRAEVVRN